MKKLVIVALAVFLAMPVLSHAGAVNNRWDMTIGGFVVYQMGWVDQETGSGLKTISRRTGTREVRGNEFANHFADIQGRLNFMIKGPDALGAKTGARLEFDFLGAASNLFNGQPYIRHAYTTLDWANDQLLFGNTWYGMMDSIPTAGYTLQSLPNAAVPSRAPQIRWTHKWTKQLTTRFGIEYPSLTGWMSANNDTVDNYTRSLYPNAFGVVEFNSDACGKIGPEMLRIGLGGTYGRYRPVYETATARGTIYSAKEEDGWMATAYTFVPIIPEKNLNKAGALGITLGVIGGQGLKYNPTIFKTMYNEQANATSAGVGTSPARDEFSAPKGYGLWAGMKIYLHDQVVLTPIYTDQWANTSNRYNSRFATQTTVNRVTLYNLALWYMPNPALTFGVEYTRQNVKYAQIGWTGNVMGTAKRTGTQNAGRIHVAYNF